MSSTLHSCFRPVDRGQFRLSNLGSHSIFVKIFQIDCLTLPLILSAYKSFRYIFRGRNDYFSISMMLWNHLPLHFNLFRTFAITLATCALWKSYDFFGYKIWVILFTKKSISLFGGFHWMSNKCLLLPNFCTFQNTIDLLNQLCIVSFLQTLQNPVQSLQIIFSVMEMFSFYWRYEIQLAARSRLMSKLWFHHASLQLSWWGQPGGHHSVKSQRLGRKHICDLIL